MIRVAVALLVSFSLLGCFPHNPRHRTYAKIGEGTAIVAGIAISAMANTGADCDEMSMPGVDNSDCKSRATWLSTVGVALIVGGLLGFVATVSTAEGTEQPKPVEIKQTTVTTEPTPATPPSPPAAQTPEQTDTPSSDSARTADPNVNDSARTADPNVNDAARTAEPNVNPSAGGSAATTP